MPSGRAAAAPGEAPSMPSADELRDARREAKVDATVFVLVAAALLVALAVVSMAADWELLGLQGWVWLVLCIPEVVLIIGLFVSAQVEDDKRRHRILQGLLALVVTGNLAGLLVLIAGLLTEKSADLTGAQLLSSGAVVWATNVIVFGIWFWLLDCGGPVQRAMHGRATPDFQYPQDENPELARPGWYPRLEDYVYVAMTNGIAFSPTDAMPLTRPAKSLMALQEAMSIAAVLLVAARAVNVLGS
jgi:hypothetical protein